MIASCTPPTCNGGIKPSLPIYPQSAISFTVHSNSAPANPTVYASTTACATANPTNATCNTTIVPITKSSSTSTFAAGSPVVLPFSPNSIVYDSNGTSAFLGVDSSNFGQKGLMIFSGTSVSQFTGAPGKVLAVSPDHTLAVISDTVDSPNQVFICNNCNSSSRSVSAFLITGATAAAFSPDSLKAYIVAGNNLYVFSKLDALKTIPLGAVANDVAFFPEGAFAYLAGGSPSAVTVRHTCDDMIADTVSTIATPSMIRALPDAATLLAVEPPNIDLVSVTGLSASGCPPTITDSITSFPLGPGNFIPTQFLVSSDGSEAYILGETQAGPPPSRFPFVIVFNISTQTPSVISLTGNATPLSASLSPAGNLLFVGADDGAVHVIDTSSQSDVQQVTFPFPTNELCFGPGNPATQVPITCNPDLVAVKP